MASGQKYTGIPDRQVPGQERRNKDELCNTDGSCTQGDSHRRNECRCGKRKIPAAQLVSLMAEGKVIIPCNKRHKSLEPNGLGSMLKTKINVNLGTSRDMTDLEMEYEKYTELWKWGRRPLWI